MKEITLEIRIEVIQKEELPDTYQMLAGKAVAAAKNAYAPYSNFCVGTAVLLSDGTVVTGSNQENAAYPLGLCAERVALFTAGSGYPDRKVEVMAIAAVTENGQTDMITPCGACRQVMVEVETRYKHPFNVLLCGKEEIYLIDKASSLLPLSFQAGN